MDNVILARKKKLEEEIEIAKSRLKTNLGNVDPSLPSLKSMGITAFSNTSVFNRFESFGLSKKYFIDKTLSYFIK